MSQRGLRLTAPPVPEHPLHRAIARALTLEIAGPGRVSRQGVVWFSVDHANFAGMPGARLGRGVIAGVPDLFVLHGGRAYFIEIKTTEGVLSEPQQWVSAALLVAGARVGVARNVPEVLGLIDAWQVPRARRIREMAA